jgi:hypothetical protein
MVSLAMLHQGVLPIQLVAILIEQIPASINTIEIWASALVHLLPS